MSEPGSTLHRLTEHLHGQEFYCLERDGRRQRDLVIFVPGLSEDRSGHSYTFAFLGRRLSELGVPTLAFDLGGQGDSRLPAAVGVWKAQFQAVLEHARRRAENVHVLARGAGTCAAGQHRVETRLALRPPSSREWAALVRWMASLGEDHCFDRADQIQPRRMALLQALGVDVRRLGALNLSAALIRDLAGAASAAPTWDRIYPVSERRAHRGAVAYLVSAGPLFTQEISRLQLLRYLVSRLGVEEAQST